MPSPQVSQILEDVLDERMPLLPLGGNAFDQLLAKGWRVLGYCMLRHNYTVWDGQLVRTIPLRVPLNTFVYSKSQRKTMRRHADLQVVSGPIELTPEKADLFERHSTRFRSGGYTSMQTFLTSDSATMPVPGLEFCVYDIDRLVACSYVHVGDDAISATYCFFDPEETKRSLGLFTMLVEMDWARRLGKRYYYHGYCHSTPSQFDYKLNFEPLEQYDWAADRWLAL